jgi:predicted DNA-binding ribbon-helix-helix protein
MASTKPTRLPLSGPDLCGLPALFQAASRPVSANPSKVLENRPARAIVVAVDRATIIKRSVRISGHPTSISIETVFWDALREIAASRRLSVNALIAAVDAERSGNLSSAIRIFVLDACRNGELGEGIGSAAAKPAIVP